MVFHWFRKVFAKIIAKPMENKVFSENDVIIFFFFKTFSAQTFPPDGSVRERNMENLTIIMFSNEKLKNSLQNQYLLIDPQKNDCVYNGFLMETLKTLSIEMVLMQKLKKSL